MTFSIVGTGNIAWFMGSRLVAAGHTCVSVYSRSTERAEALAKALNASGSYLIPGIKDDADVVLLAVTDAALKELAGKLHFDRAVVVHTAGAVAIEVLAVAAGHYGVLWPVYSIAKNDMPEHRNIPCAWQASDQRAETLLLQTGSAVTDVLFEAKYDQRKWLHLSAVIGNNFVNHLLAICERICVDNGLPLSVLLPILEQTFNRLQHTSPAEVQTGPAVRGDEPTIQNQLAMLSDHPAWQKVYAAITASIKEGLQG